MNFFRNLYLQRILSILILCVAPFLQIQVLYACDSMEDKPKQVCCCGEQDSTICPMADSCDMHEQTAKNSCCEVGYHQLNDVGMTNSVSTVDTLTLLLDGPQPPPIISFQQYLLLSLPSLSRLSLAVVQPSIYGSGKSTYLVTRRLRL